MPTHSAIELSLPELSKYFKMPEKAVAKHLGICLTSLKKICRQNGINRWPYRKIKSLDKKLRKLDAAMTHARDDPCMATAVTGYAANGYARWSEQSEQVDWSGAESPTLCPADLSNAVTPRDSSLTSPSHSGSLTPNAPFPSARRPAERKTAPDQAHMAAFVPVNVAAQSHGHGESVPIKVELSQPPAMLKEVEDDNNFPVISFGVKGLNGTGELSAADFRFAESGEQHEESHEVSVVKMEAVDYSAGAHTSQEGMSDEDLIAMLAECAANPLETSHNNFAQVLSERINAVADEMQHSYAESEMSHEAESDMGMEPGDEALMAALANCCGGQSPFEGNDGSDRSSGQPSHPEASSFSHESYNVEEEMLALDSFSGGHGMALEDFLGA